MFCPQCGDSQPDGARYCMKCGLAIPSRHRESQPTDAPLATTLLDYAGVGRRALAAILDVPIFVFLYLVAYLATMLIIIVVTTAVMTLGEPIVGQAAQAVPSGRQVGRVGASFFFLLLPLAYIVYFIVAEALFGFTVGKAILGLKVLRTNKAACGWGAATIRYVMSFVDGFLFYLIGALFAWSSPNCQRLGDRLAGTVVVRR